MTAKIQTAEELTGITGTKYFRGSDNNGDFYYHTKLNKLSGLTTVLEFTEEDDPFDYVVQNSGGLRVRDTWLTEFQYETTWEEVPLDEIVEVSMDEANWYKMHFSHYDPDSPNNKYFFVFGAGRSSGTSLDWTEQITILLKDWTTLSGKHILLYSDTSKYYIWFNLDESSTEPTVTGYTGVEVNIETGEPAYSIAEKVKDLIDGLS